MFYLPRGIRFSIFTVCLVGNNKTLEKHRAWFHNVDERKCKQMTQILVKNRGWNWLYSVGTLFTNSTFRKSLAAEGGCVGMSCHGPLAELPILLIFIWFLGTVLEEHSASAKVSGANRHLGGVLFSWPRGIFDTTPGWLPVCWRYYHWDKQHFLLSQIKVKCGCQKPTSRYPSYTKYISCLPIHTSEESRFALIVYQS